MNRMDWKEFFKPTKEFFALFMILLLLSYFSIMSRLPECKSAGFECSPGQSEDSCLQLSAGLKRMCQAYVLLVALLLATPSYLVAGFLTWAYRMLKNNR